jgi:N-glycosylase/DNA lyase
MKTRLLLEHVVSSLCWEAARLPDSAPHFIVERRPKEIWRQKIYCVLSSQFSAQRTAAVAEQMLSVVPFFDEQMTLCQIEKECVVLLTNRKIGYRFPNVRAKQIALCWFPFLQIASEYQEYLQSFESEEDARSDLIRTFPGMGLKQASMFMRNIGASRRLAIIDVHILSYLQTCHGLDIAQVTTKKYLQAEDILRMDALSHGVDLNTFDTIVWNAVKAIKKGSVYV